MDDKKTTTKKTAKPPVATVREGAIGASIFVSQSLDGNPSHYYVMSRCWKPENSKDFKYTNRMYPRNAEAISKVASMAAAKCEELDMAIDHTVTAPSEEAAQL